MLNYQSLALGMGIGFVGFAVVESYKQLRKRPNRRVPDGAMRRRTEVDQALALAFATFYENLFDREFTHFVTPEDRVYVYAVVRRFLRENRDKLGEMYFGHTAFEQGEEEAAQTIIQKAEQLFLQI